MTDTVRRIKRLRDDGATSEAAALLPAERAFPLPPDVVARLNATDSA